MFYYPDTFNQFFSNNMQQKQDTLSYYKEPIFKQMKKYLLIVILLLFLKSGWTQNTNIDYKYAIKAYNLTTYDEFERTRTSSDSSSSIIHYTSTSLQILHPTIAFQWKTKKNNFHEVELTGFMLGKLSTSKEISDDTLNSGQTTSGYDLFTTSISARYEYILNFNKTKNSKFVPSIGFGINPYYKQDNYSPKVSSLYPTSEIYIGTKVFVTPRLTYYLSSKLFFDINIPLCFIDSYFLIDKEDDPALPIEERTVTTIDFEAFPKVFSGRIGIGIKI